MTPEEKETTIRWDETSALAVLWTATPAIRKEWASYGFPITETQGGWRVEIPKDRISYKPLRQEKLRTASESLGNM